MAFTTEPLRYPPYNDESMESYSTSIVSGVLDFPTLLPTGSPQYSSMGRMDPEFLENDVAQEAADEDERPIIARGHTTRILGFQPREGQSGTHITIRLVFRQSITVPKTQVALRVKMGNIPLMTSIFGIVRTRKTKGYFELQVVAPDPVELNIVGLKVPLIIQVLDLAGAHIIDDVCVGGFKFVSASDGLTARPIHAIPTSAEGAEAPDDIESISVGISTTSTQDPLETARQRAGKYASSRKRARLSIEVPTQDVPEDIDELGSDVLSPMIVRNRSSQLSQKSGEDTYPASLEIHGNINVMTRNWSDEEDKDNRRLVEFFCVQDCGHMEVSFAPIYGESALEANRNVVSCIWWEDAEEFVITSVDTISLLEKMVGTKFTTEEKNRIRRNLQGFKPSTISKNQAESEPFFKMLMEFPPPRPRNIEKDVKAFLWSNLPSMLQKVISKYWFITSPAGSDLDENSSSQNVRVVRDSEGLPGESPTPVGPAFSTTSSPRHPNTDMNGSRNGMLSNSGYLVATPATTDHKSPSQVDHLEDSAYPSVPGMMAHNSPPFHATDALMEISEDAMQEVQALQMASSQAPVYHVHPESYTAPFELSSSDSFYGDEASVSTGHQLRGDMPFAAHTLHEYI